MMKIGLKSIIKILIATILTTIIIIGIFFYSQFSKFQYEGDGIFKDYGFKGAFERYRLTLDRVDLSIPYKRAYNVGLLPSEELFINFTFKLNQDEKKMKYHYIHSLKLKIQLLDFDNNELQYTYYGPARNDSNYSDWVTLTYSDGIPGNIIYMIYNDFYQEKEDVLLLCWLRKFCYKKQKRKLHFELFAPIEKPLNYNYMEIRISGGGWK